MPGSATVQSALRANSTSGDCHQPAVLMRVRSLNTGHCRRAPRPRLVAQSGVFAQNQSSVPHSSVRKAMKTLRAAILALAVPVSLSAQQAPAGPQANPITGVFQARTMSLQRNLAQAFDSI